MGQGGIRRAGRPGTWPSRTSAGRPGSRAPPAAAPPTPRELVVGLVDHDQPVPVRAQAGDLSERERPARRVVRRADDGDGGPALPPGLRDGVHVVLEVGPERHADRFPPRIEVRSAYRVKVGSGITDLGPRPTVTRSSASMSSLEPLPASTPSGAPARELREGGGQRVRDRTRDSGPRAGPARAPGRAASWPPAARRGSRSG